MQWVGLSPPVPAPTAVWRRRPRTARWPRGSSYAARQVAAASPSSDANSSSNSLGRDEEREETARKEKEEKAASSFLMRNQKYAMLKQQLAVAAQFKDYKEAARLRDALRSFEEEEPVPRLRRLLKNAVEEERVEILYSYITIIVLVMLQPWYLLVEC